MAEIPVIESNNKVEVYDHILKHYKKLVREEKDWIANLANAASILGNHLQDINWAGFYLLKNDELVLGPFYGRPAVSRIKIGNGVCGTAIAEKKNQIVPKVCEFPGHISCDIRSQSEIVLNFYYQKELVGVLDIDSPSINRFDKVDEKYLLELLRVIENASRRRKEINERDSLS